MSLNQSSKPFNAEDTEAMSQCYGNVMDFHQAMFRIVRYIQVETIRIGLFCLSLEINSEGTVTIRRCLMYIK